MNENVSPSDVLRDVITMLNDSLDVVVGDSLPEGAALGENMPVVVVDILPSETAKTAFGGHGFPVMSDTVPVDVEVFAPSRAQAYDIAVMIRPLLYQLPHLAENDVVGVDCPQFATREDLSPKVKVLGAIADLTTRT